MPTILISLIYIDIINIRIQLINNREIIYSDYGSLYFQIFWHITSLNVARCNIILYTLLLLKYYFFICLINHDCFATIMINEGIE